MFWPVMTVLGGEGEQVGNPGTPRKDMVALSIDMSDDGNKQWSGEI